jgi:hypothetical protein
MTTAIEVLRDDAARLTAIGVHDRSILVEAGGQNRRDGRADRCDAC